MSRKRFWPEPTITGLYLANFKGFGPDGCHIPLRPLTLIYGPNSGGKSTVLKGFSSIAQSKAQGLAEGRNQDWVSEGPWFDLGSKKQVMHQPQGRKKPQGEFTIGFSSSYHYPVWLDPIIPTVWETGTPILNLTEGSETMKHLEEIFDLFDAEDWDGLTDSIPGLDLTASSLPIHSAVFLARDTAVYPHYENDLQAYTYDKWPEGFEHQSLPSEEFNLLERHIWFLLCGSILQYYNELGPHEDAGDTVVSMKPIRAFLRALNALHVSSITSDHATIDFHWDQAKSAEMESTEANHGYTMLRVDLDMLRKLDEYGDTDNIDPFSDMYDFVGVGGSYGAISRMVFDIPPASGDSFYLLQSSWTNQKDTTIKSRLFATSENADYSVDDIIGAFRSSNKSEDASVVEDWVISGDKIYLRSNLSSVKIQCPILFIGSILKFENRLDLIFTHDSTGYSLNGFDFHEVRGGSWHKLISGKSIEWDDDMPLLFSKERQRHTVHKVTHHQYPDLQDQSVPAKDAEEISAYSKTVRIMARVFFPLLYSHSYNMEDDILELTDRENNSIVDAFRGAGQSSADEIIELIDLEYKTGAQKHAPLTIYEKKAIRHFYQTENSSFTKKSWMFREFILHLVKPRRRAIHGVSQSGWSGHVEDPSAISRAKLVSLFGIDKKILTPRVAIPVGIYRSEFYQFAQSTMHVLPPEFETVYRRLHSVLNLVADESGRIDYLSASRLSPRRYYAQADHDSTASATGSTLANLNSKFPRNSPSLAKLNELMARIVGMEVSFGKLRSTDGQETNLLDIRVGRPGSSRKKFAQLPDVGYGVSQTLPLVAAIVNTGESSPDTTLVIEEAESNLHPAAQSRLMDAIIENLNTDIPSPKIVLETHSEHFLLTVLRHLEEGQLDIEDEDIAILYVDNDNPEGTTEVHHMETRKGDFLSPWPRENWDDPTSPII